MCGGVGTGGVSTGCKSRGTQCVSSLHLALVVPEKSKYQTHLLEEKLIRCEACSR